MKQFFSLIILISISLSSQTYSPEVEARIKQVEENLFKKFKIEGQPNATLKERMAFYHVVGLSIAVVNDYKVEWAKGYGWADSSEKRPVTHQTLFEPGSISKSLNSVGVLKLTQDKKIDLYTDINTYLTSWKFPYDKKSKGKKITIANLLSHTGGLTLHGFPGYEIGDTIPTLQQILDGVRPCNTGAVRSEFEPGLRYMYSGGGTTISQLIMNEVTKQPYDVWMFENVLKPIGMTNSSYSQPQPLEKRNQMATGYMPYGPVKNKYHVYPEQAAAGLWTTPTDLCKFIIETQLSLQGRSNKVLSQETTKRQLTPYVDSTMGLGVFIYDPKGTKYFQHGAGNEGFSGTYYGSYEGGKGVAIVCNSLYGNGVLSELVNSVARVYEWKDFGVDDKTITKKIVRLHDSTASKYIGYYITETKVGEIFKKDDNYYFSNEREPWKMYFSSEKSFFNLESTSEKFFTFDKNGNVTGFKRYVDGKENTTAYKLDVMPMSEDKLQKYVGTYAKDNESLRMQVNNKQLWFVVGKDSSKVCFINPKECFVVEDRDGFYFINMNKKGGVLGFTRKENNESETFKKIK